MLGSGRTGVEFGFAFHLSPCACYLKCLKYNSALCAKGLCFLITSSHSPILVTFEWNEIQIRRNDCVNIL